MKIENRPILILTKEETELLDKASDLLWDIATKFPEDHSVKKYALEASHYIDCLEEQLEHTDWAKGE